MSIHYEETQYGFDYGAAKVRRLSSGEEKGWVTLGIDTAKERIQVYITKTGKVRIYGDDGEWTKPAKGETP